MTTREKIIVGVMCLTIVYGAYELLGAQTAKKPTAAATANPMEELRKFVAEVMQKMDTGKLGGEYQYLVGQAGTDWTRDPFLPSTLPLKQQRAAQATSQKPSGPSGPDQAFVFTGFLQIGNSKLAVINAKEYEVGEALDVQGYYLKSLSSERAVIGRVDGSETIQVPLTEVD